MTTAGTGMIPPALPRIPDRILRLCGVLAFLGLLAYALMFAGFAYEDRNLLEGIGAAGWVLVALSVLVASLAITKRGRSRS